MQPAIVNVSQPPATTLSFDTIVYLGQNQIRRNVGKSTSLIIGKSVVDRTLTLASANSLSGSSINIEDEFIIGMYICTDRPLKIALQTGDDTPVVLKVHKILVLDMKISGFILSNEDADLDANVKLTYIVNFPDEADTANGPTT